MPRPIAKDHDAKRSAILKAAALVFARDGYDRAAMTGVAIEVGVSKALIYHYYTSKEVLLFDILHSHLGGLRDLVREVEPAATAEWYLRDLVHTLLNAYQDADDEHILQLEALRALPPDRQKVLTDIQREIVAVFSAAISASHPGAVARTDLRAVTMSLFGMLNWFYMWHQSGRGMARQDYADLATDLLLGGLERLDR